MQERHVGFFQPAASLAVIAAWTGRNHIRPDMSTLQMLGKHVVKGQVGGVASAILAGIIIPAEDLATGQLDL